MSRAPPTGSPAPAVGEVGAPLPWRNRALLVRGGLTLAVTVAVVVGLTAWVGGGDVLGVIVGVGAGHLLAATALTLTLPVVHAWRLRAVLGAVGYRLGTRRTLELIMAAWPISSITPSKSGDLIKAYYLRREVPSAVTVGGLLAERVLDLAVIGALGLVGALATRQPAIALVSAAVLGAILAFLALAPRATRLRIKPAWSERIELLLSGTRALGRSGRLLALTLGLTLASWLLAILVTAVLFDAVGAPVPLPYAFAAMPPALLAGSLPFTLGGMGTRDSLIIVLFDPYATAAQSLSVGLLYAVFVRWLLSALGIPFFLWLLRER